MRQVAFILPKRFFFSNDNQIKEDAEKRFDFFLTQDIGIYIYWLNNTRLVNCVPKCRMTIKIKLILLEEKNMT